MIKKSISVLLSLMLLVSCFSLTTQAAEVEASPSGGSSVSVSAEKAEYFNVIISVDTVSNVQGILLDYKKALGASADYLGYELMTDKVFDANVFVNEYPDGAANTDIMASILFEDGGVSFTKKTDIIKFKYLAKATFSDLTAQFFVKEFYNSYLDDIDSSKLSIRYEGASSEPQLKAVVVSSPSKTSYYVGDSLDLTGLKVVAFYSDNTSKTVTSDAEVTGYDPARVGKQALTVTYGGKTATFYVTVNEVEVSSLVLSSAPAKVNYSIGEIFDSTGAVIKANLTNGTTANVTSSVTYSGFSSATEGTKTITASYGEKSVTFNVNVAAKTVSSIYINSMPSKVVYSIGESFSSAGISVIANMSDGSTQDVTSGVSYSGFSSSTAGTKTVTVAYSGKTTSFNVVVNSSSANALTNNSSLSASTVVAGNPVTAIGAASGGTSPYKYAFYIKKSSDTTWKLKGTEYGTATTMTFTPGYPEPYQVKVNVKDSNGTVTTKTLTVSVTAASLINNSTLSATTVKQGSEVKVTGAASGGVSPYKYAFYIKKSSDSSWKLKGTEYGTATTMTFTPGYAEPYQVKVNVKDSNGTVTTKTLTVSVTAASLANNSKLSATTVKQGSEVKVTGAASGGVSPYKYAFYIKKSSDTSWKLKGTEYGTATTMTFTPGYAETYQVKVNVKDAVGTVVTKTLTVNVTANALVNNSTLSATTVKQGNEVKVTGAASGGTSPYKYAFYIKKSSDTAWKLKGTEYGTATTMTFTPGYAETYQVKVNVKDSKGTVATKTLTVNVTANALTNNSTVSSTKVTKNSTVTVKGAASGGVSPYKYAFYIKKSSDTSWKLKGTEYGTATTMTFTPGYAEPYQVKVNVKDSNGTVVTKTFTVTVTDT